MPDLRDTSSSVAAGIAAAPLIADPQAWINRRVETIELLSHEETRRKVSVDFTLSKEQVADLRTPHGVVVPISVLTKEARRNFDLRDEGGRAVPVLGRWDNGSLAHTALLATAVDVLPDADDEALGAISRHLDELVHASAAAADEVREEIAARAGDDPLYAALWQDVTCRSLMETLSANYVLFAVLPEDGARRRVLKYSYGEYFDATERVGRLPFSPGELADRFMYPDRRPFLIGCPAAGRARSFHVEVSIPEELRVRTAFLVDQQAPELVSAVDENVDRASLYADVSVGDRDIHAYVETVPERVGVTSRAAGIAMVVSGLLWVGVLSGLDARNPAPAVAILLAGAALYSGMYASAGEHRLVRSVYRTGRRWLNVVAVAALVGAVALALEVPDQDPVAVWAFAGLLSTAAALRLGWSAVRAPA